jgi:DNA-binding CsgD family transcriptional regulator
MSSRDEIVRGWDLFRLGAFAEAESLIAPYGREPEALRLYLWIAIRRADIEGKRQYGELLSQVADANLAAVGRAHENVALASLNGRLKAWFTPQSPWAKSEVAFAKALVAFTEGRGTQVRAELAAASPHTAEQRVRYAQLRAWEPAINDEFLRQAVGLLRSLRLALDGDVDRTLVALIAAPLAFLMREVELDDLSPLADELLGRVVWPVDNSEYRYYGQWAIAWRMATVGKWIPAMTLLHNTLLVAPNEFSKALIYADRARISLALNERVAASSARMHAYDCLDNLNWSEVTGGEAITALSMMDVLATDLDRARSLQESLSRVRTSKLLGDSHGRRYGAFRAFAKSHLTVGSPSLAHAQEAYNLFKGMRYVHRAADCALRAAQVGGGARWRHRVERLLEPYPLSLTAREYERTLSPLGRIQGRRRELMRLLATSHASARDIGRSIGMGKETVRDHVKAMYRILGIENRLQLVRMYMEARLDGYDVDDSAPASASISSAKWARPVATCSRKS